MAAIGPSGKRRHKRGSHRGGNFVGRAQQPGRSSSDKECGLMAQKKAAEPIAPRAKLEIEFQEPHLLGPLFGEFHRNLVAIEDRLGVYIAPRGRPDQIYGGPEAAALAPPVLTGP